MFMKRLVHDENGVYFIDEECLKKKEIKEQEKEMRWQKRNASQINKKRKKPL